MKHMTLSAFQWDREKIFLPPKKGTTLSLIMYKQSVKPTGDILTTRLDFAMP